MADHPNAVLARRMWNAFCDGDVSRLEALFTPDVVWRTAGRDFLGAEVKGFEASVEWIARSAESVEELRSKLLDVFASDGGAVIWASTHAVRGPQSLETDYLLRLRIAAGRIFEVCAVPVDQRHNDEFWRLH